MSFSLSDSFRRTVSFRLTAWYAGIFMTSLVVLYGIIYVSLGALLVKADREAQLLATRDFAEAYKGGADALENLATGKRVFLYLVRVADPQNHTIMLAPAKQVPQEDVDALEKLPLRAEVRWWQAVVPSHETLEMTTIRLHDGNYLQVGHNDSRRRVFLLHFRNVCLAVLGPVLLLGTIGGAFMAHVTLRPLQHLNDAAREIIATGRLETRLASSNTASDLSDLVTTFNELIARIDGLIRSMRGTLDNLAHDLRTPLARLAGIAELALNRPDDSIGAREALADCIEECGRLSALLDALMDISECETGTMKLNLEAVSLNDAVHDAVDLYGPVAEDQSVELSAQSRREVSVMADPIRVRQAIANLVDNAIKYTPAGGGVVVTVNEMGGEAKVVVSDTGPGIPIDEQSRVWERLYRCDPSRSQRGLGLGLSLVRAVMRAHDGRADLESAPGGGSKFTLSFPSPVLMEPVPVRSGII